MTLLPPPHATCRPASSRRKPQSIQECRRTFFGATIWVIPKKASGSNMAMRDLLNCCLMGSASIAVPLGAVTVSVELAEVAPGITVDGESAQVGIGDGPVTAQ